MISWRGALTQAIPSSSSMTGGQVDTKSNRVGYPGRPVPQISSKSKKTNKPNKVASQCVDAPTRIHTVFGLVLYQSTAPVVPASGQQSLVGV